MKDTIIYKGFKFEYNLDHQPEEPQTRDYPGCAEEFEIYDITLNGIDASELFEENQRRAGIRHAMYLLESFKEDYYSVDAKSLYNSIDVLCDFVRSKGAYIEPLNWTSKEVLQVDNNGWIKIESEKDLPKINQNVIIYDGLSVKDFYYFNNLKEFRSFYEVGGRQTISENVTHWMPLPEPPKF